MIALILSVIFRKKTDDMSQVLQKVSLPFPFYFCPNPNLSSFVKPGI